MNLIKNNFQSSSWYIFDKIVLGSAASALRAANSDNIFIGRYILVKYCDGILTSDERHELEMLAQKAGATEADIINPTADKINYFKHYKQDGAIRSYDRTVFQKTYSIKNNACTYEPICNLNEIQNTAVDPDGDGDITIVGIDWVDYLN